MQDKTYEERISIMNLPSLTYRRKRGDLIEMYKYTHGLYDVNKDLIQYSDNNFTRGHQYKLKKRNHRLNIRKYFFTYRTVDVWNTLPKTVVNAPSVDSFKSRIDQYLNDERYFH